MRKAAGRPLLFLAGFLACFLALLLGTAPATLGERLLPALSQGQLALAATRGSLWRGEGLLLLGREQDFRLLGWLRWRLGWADGPMLELRLDQGQLQLTPAPSGLALSSQDLRLPATLLPWLHGKLPRSGWQGWLGLEQFEARNLGQGWAGKLALSWHGAGHTSLAPAALGDYRLTGVWGETGQGEFQLHTLAGPLQLEGRLQGQPGGRYRLEGQAWHPGRPAPALETWLAQLGRRDPQQPGRHLLQLEWGGKTGGGKAGGRPAGTGKAAQEN